MCVGCFALLLSLCGVLMILVWFIQFDLFDFGIMGGFLLVMVVFGLACGVWRLWLVSVCFVCFDLWLFVSADFEFVCL